MSLLTVQTVQSAFHHVAGQLALSTTPDPSFDELDRQQGEAWDRFTEQQDQAQDLAFATMVVVVVLGVVGLVYTAFWIWTLIDAATIPESAWDEVGQHKVLWIVAMALVGVLSIVYVFWPRPALRRAATARKTAMDTTADEPVIAGAQA